MLLQVAPCADLPVSVSLNETVRDPHYKMYPLLIPAFLGLSAAGKKLVATKKRRNT